MGLQPRCLKPTSLHAEERPFNESAAQVRKLLSRDKKELMGAEEIGQRARTEFDEEETIEDISSTNGSSDGSSIRTRNFGGGQFAMPVPSLCQPAFSAKVFYPRLCHLHACHSVLGCTAQSQFSVPAAGSRKPANPFGDDSAPPQRIAKGPTNPFGSGPSSAAKPFIEPSGLSPTMKPAPLDDTPWYKKITFGQIVSLFASGVRLIGVAGLSCLLNIAGAAAAHCPQLHPHHRSHAGHLCCRGESGWSPFQ